MQTLSKQTLKIFWQHAMRYKWHAFGVTFFVLLVTALDIYRPLLYRDFFNLLEKSGVQNPRPLFHTLSLILGVVILHRIAWTMVDVVNNYFQPRVMADLTYSCYVYLQQHSFSFFSNSFVGSLVTRVKRFERAFEQIADQIYINLGRAMLRTILILMVLLTVHWLFTVIIIMWAILYTTFTFLFAEYKLRYDQEKATADTKVTAQLADSITNNINIKLFTSYSVESKNFTKVNENQFKLRKLTWDLGTIASFIQGSLMILLEISLLYVAIRLWQRGQVQLGDFVLLQAYLSQIFDKLWEVSRYIRAIYESLADANEMTEILLTPHAVQDMQNAATLSVASGSIDFTDVRFAYHDKQPVFKNFTLHINPGERVALVGSSGGGKTTIVKLLFRFYDIQRGTICIDGQNIAQVTQDSLRLNLSLVPQEPILFHRSLFENIRYGKPQASTAEVMQAARLAHCHEFISRFPDKYETLVGERGVKLSGGERQRVAIARAILKNAPILVLDEATSSLDSESELFIQDALKTLMLGKTTIVIAHRLSTIMQMDRILVLENGRVSEEGTHKELLKAKQGTYQKLWHIQAGGFAQS